MKEDPIVQIANEVIRRLVKRVHADGEGRELVVVFSGATVGLKEAFNQLQLLLLDGFRLQVAMTEAAEHLYGDRMKEFIKEFAGVEMVQPSRWLGCLLRAEAVVVPLLSLSTASRAALLIADSPAANLILHGLLMGKPVVMARNGADPEDEGRKQLGFANGNAALQKAVAQRLRALEELGCTLSDVGELRSTLNHCLAAQARAEAGEPTRDFSRRAVHVEKRIVSAADVMEAHRIGADLRYGSSALLTPLARDYASRHGVNLVKG